jgi:hypothetical protein
MTVELFESAWAILYHALEAAYYSSLLPLRFALVRLHSHHHHYTHHLTRPTSQMQSGQETPFMGKYYPMVLSLVFIGSFVILSAQSFIARSVVRPCAPVICYVLILLV